MRVFTFSFTICYSSTEFYTSIWCFSSPIKRLHHPHHTKLLQCRVFQSFQYMVRMQLSGYLRKNVLIQLFCCIGTYEPLQPICRWFFFSFLLYFIFIFFPSHQHDSIVVCYSTRVQSGISNSISKRSSSLIL